MLYGAMIGDIVGSKYEFNNIRTKDFNFFDKDMFFTDDTVMSVAVYEALKETYKNKYKNLANKTVEKMQEYGKLYPYCSYGGRFSSWLRSSDPQPYNSFGNGSAMRVSPVAYFAKSIDETKKLSRIVTSVTHNHPEGIKGAEATAVSIYLALNKKNKNEIKKYIEDNYYSMNFDYEDLRKNYYFNEICQDTVPQALFCFFESKDFEDAIRTGISIGGDSDTLCAITGAVAEAYYGVNKKTKEEALSYLDKRLYNVIKESDLVETILKEKLNSKDIQKSR
jgi:type I restriction enzyme M protein